jgi:pimeloyl-ACP methyl ester carboxylesterase
LLDQRGPGASDWGGGPHLGRATDDLLLTIDRLGPVHAVVGHSYGALVALEAARVSSVIPRLAVYEPPLSLQAPIMEPERVAAVRAAVDAGEYETALRLHLESPIGGMSPAEADAFATNPLTRSMYADLVVQAPSIAPALETVIPLDDAEPYRAVTAPTLLLLGSESVENPFRRSITALDDAIPDSCVAMLEGQTHMATLFAPHLVADALREFLIST